MAEMEFPEEYPNLPPKLTFRTKMWHPSSALYCLPQRFRPSSLTMLLYIDAVYDNGGVCISILVRHNVADASMAANESEYSIPRRWTNMDLRT